MAKLKLPDFVKIPSMFKRESSGGVDKALETAEKILEKIKEGQSQSADFDIFGQTNPGNTTDGVREQLFGKDLYYLRSYYTAGNAPIDQIVINRMVKQAQALSTCIEDSTKRIGWRVVAEGYDSPSFKPPKNYEKQCRWFETLIKNINIDRHPGGFKDGFISNVRNALIYDRIAIEKLLYTSGKNDGKPASYIIPDPLTIKPTTWALSVMAGAQGYSGKSAKSEVDHLFQQDKQVRDNLVGESKDSMAQQITQAKNSKGRFTTEYHERDMLEGGLIKYVQQMQDRQIAMGWSSEEMSVFIANPQNMINASGWSAGSPFETSFAFKEVIWRATGYNQELFDSKTPEGFLAMRKGGMDPKTRKALKERMLDEGSDRFSNIMVHLVDDPDKDLKYVKTKDKPTDMQFEKLFILYVKFILAGYGMDYTELNLEDGKSGGLQGAGAAIARMNVNKQTGFISTIDHVADCYTQAMIHPWCEELGVKFKMEFIYDVTQTKEQIEILTSKNAFSTMQELRQEVNLDPDWNIPKDVLSKNKEHFDMVKKWLNTPGVTSANLATFVTKEMELKQQKELAEQAQEQEAKQVAQEEEQPEGEPKEDLPDEDIASLQKLVNGAEEKPMEKSVKNDAFAIDVTYDYS